MLIELLSFGTLTFWAVFAFFFLLILLQVLSESTGWAVATIALYVAGLFVFGPFSFVWIKENPIFILQILGFYVIVGILFSIAKWLIYSREAKKEYEKIKMNYLTRNNLKSISEENRSDFKLYLKDNMNFRGSKLDFATIIPQVSQNKELIIFWMSFWPWSITISIFSDFLNKFWNMIYSSIRALYQAITNFMFKDAIKDLDL
jgi:hypothetical protein